MLNFLLNYLVSNIIDIIRDNLVQSQIFISHYHTLPPSSPLTRVSTHSLVHSFDCQYKQQYSCCNYYTLVLGNSQYWGKRIFKIGNNDVACNLCINRLLLQWISTDFLEQMCSIILDIYISINNNNKNAQISESIGMEFAMNCEENLSNIIEVSIIFFP